MLRSEVKAAGFLSIGCVLKSASAVYSVLIANLREFRAAAFVYIKLTFCSLQSGCCSLSWHMT